MECFISTGDSAVNRRFQLPSRPIIELQSSNDVVNSRTLDNGHNGLLYSGFILDWSEEYEMNSPCEYLRHILPNHWMVFHDSEQVL